MLEKREPVPSACNASRYVSIAYDKFEALFILPAVPGEVPAVLVTNWIVNGAPAMLH